jgi:hypothetical protein
MCGMQELRWLCTSDGFGISFTSRSKSHCPLLMSSRPAVSTDRSDTTDSATPAAADDRSASSCCASAAGASNEPTTRVSTHGHRAARRIKSPKQLREQTIVDRLPWPIMSHTSSSLAVASRGRETKLATREDRSVMSQSSLLPPHIPTLLRLAIPRWCFSPHARWWTRVRTCKGV